MKKVLALVLVGTLLSAIPVMAGESPNAAVVASSTEKNESSSIPATVQQQAAAESKSVGEYANNAVSELPGVPDVTPMGQGGHVIINGAPSNVTFFLTKPSKQIINEAKAQATALGGKVLNVVGTKSAVINKFETASVNFYAKGIKAGQNIKAYQKIDGVWVEIVITEIREDHIVVNMTQHGNVVFIEVPAALAK